MNTSIKTLVLAMSVACLSGVAMADTEVSVDTNLQDTLSTISKQGLDGSALNLAVNTGNVDASVNTKGTGFEYSSHPFETTGSMNQLQGDIKTTAIGAANTGEITLEQGSTTVSSKGTFNATLNTHWNGSVTKETSSETESTKDSSQLDTSDTSLSTSSDKTSEGFFNDTTSSQTLDYSKSTSNESNKDSSYYSLVTSSFNKAVESGVDATMDSMNSVDAATTASNYAASNMAYNSGDINASVNTTGFTNTLGSIETTAVGAANTGTITVTVK